MNGIKTYTNYEGTQLQRKLETEIRKQKDIQIMAKASGNKELVQESQQKITQLTRKYKELSDVSGLPTKLERARVSGYRRTKVNLKKYYKENLIGIENNGLKIENISEHFTERAMERKVYLEDTKNAFTNPLFIDKIKTDKNGRKSVKIVGEKATISINPENNTLITVYKTGKRIRNKYKR